MPRNLPPRKRLRGSYQTATGWALLLIVLLANSSRAATWKIETVDQSGVGKFSSLKIDQDGNAHLAYVVDDGKDTLKYGFWDHALNRWFMMKVAEGASFSSLTLDSKQRPRISWADSGTIVGCKLRYAEWDGKSWHTQAVPLAADTIAYYTSISLDPNDNPSISFYEYDGPRGSSYRVRMRVVTFNGKYWEVSTADGDNQSGKFNSLAVDARGHVHLAYANVNAGTGSMRYAFWDGTQWRRELIDGREQNDQGYVGYGACITLDKEGNPHVTYNNYTDPAIKYAFRKDNHWTISVVERLSGVGYPDRNSIALDDDGQPYIGYYDAGNGRLRLAHRAGQVWIAETVDTGGVGFTSALQVRGGMVWISYADEGGGGVKVARAPLSSVRGTSVSNLRESEKREAAQQPR